mmetsp:Transcript_33202/g.65166  ORF Transcript_33202/g.65166 Transcript_33202/m.65166 type:complete len:348 (+) Transcript_33202:1716-2759(+)
MARERQRERKGREEPTRFHTNDGKLRYRDPNTESELRQKLVLVKSSHVAVDRDYRFARYCAAGRCCRAPSVAARRKSSSRAGLIAGGVASVCGGPVALLSCQTCSSLAACACGLRAARSRRESRAPVAPAVQAVVLAVAATVGVGVVEIVPLAVGAGARAALCVHLAVGACSHAGAAQRALVALSKLAERKAETAANTSAFVPLAPLGHARAAAGVSAALPRQRVGALVARPDLAKSLAQATCRVLQSVPLAACKFALLAVCAGAALACSVLHSTLVAHAVRARCLATPPVCKSSEVSPLAPVGCTAGAGGVELALQRGSGQALLAEGGAGASPGTAGGAVATSSRR